MANPNQLPRNLRPRNKNTDEEKRISEREREVFENGFNGTKDRARNARNAMTRARSTGHAALRTSVPERAGRLKYKINERKFNESPLGQFTQQMKGFARDTVENFGEGVAEGKPEAQGKANSGLGSRAANAQRSGVADESNQRFVDSKGNRNKGQSHNADSNNTAVGTTSQKKPTESTAQKSTLNPEEEFRQEWERLTKNTAKGNAKQRDKAYKVRAEYERRFREAHQDIDTDSLKPMSQVSRKKGR
jgi:hypothetical protein